MSEPTAFENIHGYEELKDALRSGVITPLLKLKTQSDSITSTELTAATARRFLLHGPPGCGKSLLANAVARAVEHHSINTYKLSLQAIQRHEIESAIKHAFLFVRKNQPSLLLIDEIDWLFTDHSGGSEMFRRYRTELILQFRQYQSEKHIFILACTNEPWTLHRLLINSFEERLFVPLPSFRTRMKLLQHPLFYSSNCSRDDWRIITHATKGYSYEDIRALKWQINMNVLSAKSNARAVVELTFLDYWRILSLPVPKRSVQPSVSSELLREHFNWAMDHTTANRSTLQKIQFTDTWDEDKEIHERLVAAANDEVIRNQLSADVITIDCLFRHHELTPT